MATNPADLFGSSVNTVNSTEGPALGVAILAGVGAGLYKNVPEACDSIIKVKSEQTHNAHNHQVYQGYYKLYNKLYHSLKEDFKTLAQL